MRKALIFLGIMDDRDLDWLVRNGTLEPVPKGGVLIHEGQQTKYLYFILDGAFSVYVKQKEMAKLFSGELVGEMSFVDSRPPSATVTASMDSSVLSIPRDVLAEKLEDDVGFAARFYKGIAVFLSDRLRVANNLGYGNELELNEDIEDKDELAPHLMDTLALAGMRFKELQRRVHGS
jgi:CRP/FNR family cyclic AMP-dependent transcriptional regulator